MMPLLFRQAGQGHASTWRKVIGRRDSHLPRHDYDSSRFASIPQNGFRKGFRRKLYA